MVTAAMLQEDAKRAERTFTECLRAYGASDARTSAAFRALTIADAKAIKASREDTEGQGMAENPKMATPQESADALAAMRRTFGFMNRPDFADYYGKAAS